MTLQEIKLAVDKGKDVYWDNMAYTVIKDIKGQYFIKGHNHSIGLTWADGITLNGKEQEFFTQ